MIIKAAIALGIPAAIVFYFWWRYVDPMWIVTLPFGVLIFLLIVCGWADENIRSVDQVRSKPAP